MYLYINIILESPAYRRECFYRTSMQYICSGICDHLK